MFPFAFTLLALSSCLLSTLAQSSTCSTINTVTTPVLNITALDAVDGKSVIQCWQLDPFTISSTPGTVGALALNLGDTSQAEYIIIPGRYNAGIHNAGAKQYVLM
jgi:hypothetical protein